MTPWRWLGAAVIVAAVVLGFTGPASAHAGLLSSDPAADSVLDASPSTIRLAFTEAVDPTDDAIRLIAADGTTRPVGDVRQDSGSASITVTIDEKNDYDSDDMKVQRNGDRLVHIGKTLSADETDAESIGMLAFQGEGPKLFSDQIDAMMRTAAGTKN